VKATIQLAILSIMVLVFVSAVVGAEKDDPVFRAMSDELTRSMDRLVIEGMPSPYFLGYRVRDYETVTVSSRYGALVESQPSHNRYLYIDLRVGSPTQDNTNYFSSWGDIWNGREGVVEENSYQGLRHQLWYYTDGAYKNALEKLARKKAYLQAHPVKEEVPDFSAEESFTMVAEPVKLTVDRKQWENRVRDAGRAFADFSTLEDWKIEYTAQAVNQWYVNSEGSRQLKGDVYQFVEVSATTQADDGQRLTGFLHYVTRSGQEPPSTSKMMEDIQKMARELQEAASAPAMDEYVGPVLFTDWAAAQFFSQLMADQLTLPRKPLMASDRMSEMLPVGKLAGKVKRRVLPQFVTITDEPRREDWNGTKLAGYQLVDDEGVESQNITLVENGRLQTLPMGRQPTRKVAKSNGHAHSTTYQMTVPGISNMVVETSQPMKMDHMIEELKRLCLDQEIEYGLLVKRLEEPSFEAPYRWIDSQDDSRTLLTAPLVVYKVYAEDGRMEPVRGLEFDEVSVRTLRDIVALGKDQTAYNIVQPTIFQDSYYPASIVTPSILVEEMELKGTTVHEPKPIAANPYFQQQ
jgi:TldD protein